MQAANLFDFQAFQGQLTTQHLGRAQFIYREVTDSTMNIAKREANEAAPSGTMILAEVQTQGRGRVEGRVWQSPPGNLYFTWIYRCKTTEDQFKLNLASSVAVARALREEGANARVKWPNDVWIGAKKVSGMLIDDASSADGGRCLSVGVGINVNQDFAKHDDEALRESATGLAQALGISSVPRERVLANYCNNIEKLMSCSLSEVLSIYVGLDMLLGKQVVVMPKKAEHPERYTAEAIEFTTKGFLKVRKTDGEEKLLSAEEVTIRPETVDLAPTRRHPDAATLITGTWKNQLGSRVIFRALPDGVLEGEYHTAVGNAVVTHPLRGCWTDLGMGEALMGWSVAWTNLKEAWRPRSLAAWSGKLFIIDGACSLRTSWHLTSDLPDSDRWKSVVTNQDQFDRCEDLPTDKL